MALEMPLRKSNVVQNMILFLGLSIWKKLSDDLIILNTATSFTHNYENLPLKKLGWVEHNFNYNFNHYCHY